VRYRDDLAERFQVIENVWIPMPDGCRLAARIWLPRSAAEEPVPAVLEYIPYRKRFGTAHRDAVTLGFMAANGYACVRVDLRGSGESDGVLRDEYLQQELDDGVEVLRWISGQDWCNGNIGMMGISWGGFNALQIAALRPPELKAVLTLSSTDDRYADDIHHMGGCLLGDNLSWSAVMFAYNSLPPDPALVPDRWRSLWFARLENSGLWLDTWLRHQRRDEYWKHGSICEDYDAIECPVYAVSGWADGYSNSVFRLLRNLNAPCKGLIGPWSHRYPHFGVPGPAIDFVSEALRWWDHWLKGINTGIMDEPRLRVWMQDSVPPYTSYEHRPGRWVAETSWPSEIVKHRPFTLATSGLVEPEAMSDESSDMPLSSPLTLGLFAGKWCSYASGPDLAGDQRLEDGGALVFDSNPLEEPLEILGPPIHELEVASDRPVAMLAARLSDVRPNGEVTRLTYGLLNLTHRDSSENPTPLEPNRFYGVRLQLNDIAFSIPARHRLRVALSTTYWPLAWPPPDPAQVVIRPGASRLLLPERVPQPHDTMLRSLGEPQGTPPPSITRLVGDSHSWTVHHDLASGQATLEVIDDRGTIRHDDIDLVVQACARERYSSVGNDFGSVQGETLWQRSLRRGDWSVRTTTRTVLTTSDSNSFHLRADLDAYETDKDGERRVFARSWEHRIPRHLL